MEAGKMDETEEGVHTSWISVMPHLIASKPGKQYRQDDTEMNANYVIY